jgi:hypothetical protein
MAQHECVILATWCTEWVSGTHAAACHETLHSRTAAGGLWARLLLLLLSL